MTQADPPLPVAPHRNRRGFALLFVLLVLMAVAAMALTAVILRGNTRLMTAYEENEAQLEAVADAGLELARARINGQPSLYPDTGYAMLENGVTVTDAFGAVIPNVRRYTYAGPTGVATGQFGVFGSIVSVAETPGGARVIRRAEVFQESFAKYAYFTDDEPSTIKFGSGDQIQGPVHSNDIIGIYSSRATFRGPGTVTTARYIDGKQYGTFLEGYQEAVARIELPATAELEKLRTYATAGRTAFVAPAGGNADEARIRIEFVNIDLDGDLQKNGPDEGFFKVYTSNQADWLMALEPGLGWPASENCGHRTVHGVRDTFMTPKAFAGSNDQKRQRVAQAGSRCYLGGDSALFLKFKPNDGKGQWIARGWNLAGTLPAALAARDDRDFLYPLSRRFNADFKGVIHVTGRVAISGTLRGRVTLAATGSIFVVDDTKYSVDPGAGSCTDILGIFSGGEIMIADNTINTPQQPLTTSAAWYSLDDTSSEFLQGVMLTLNTFGVQNFDGGPTAAQPCEATARGRGCLYLTGGIIQRTRGGVGTTTGHGYLKRYSYDVCAYRQPPPYFPTTGHFGKGRYYEIDPQGFTPASFFDRFTAG